MTDLPAPPGELSLQTLIKAVAVLVTTLGSLLIDADHLRNINDTFGHKGGDSVLRMVAQSTANGVRLGNCLAPGLSLDPAPSAMEVSEVGWLGTMPFTRQYLVLSGPWPRGPVQVVITSVVSELDLS